MIKKDKRGTKLECKTVLFVETPGGELAKRLRQTVSRMSKWIGFLVKVVERGGTRVDRILTSTNPWRGQQRCGRKKCVPCEQCTKNGKPVDCFERNILYESECIVCRMK